MKAMSILILAILPVFAACGGGGGSGGGKTMSTPQVKLQIWWCTVYRMTEGLTGLQYWGSCYGSNWDLLANQPVFTSQEDCDAAIRELKNTDPIIYDNSDEDKQRGWAVKLICSEPDTTAPTVLSLLPADGAGGVSIDGLRVRVAFSDMMDSKTIDATTFTVEDASGTPLAGTVDYSWYSRTAFFEFEGTLPYLATYTAQITTGITDKVGNPLDAEYSWSFTTKSNPDVFAPAVTSLFPAADSICAPKDGIVTVRFDDQIIVTSGTFTLEDSSGAPVDGTASFGASTATFTPSSPLDDNAAYTAHLGGVIGDAVGNISTPSTWSFRTELAAEGTWAPIATPATLGKRAGHRAIWTGSEMIIWGGYDWISANYPYIKFATDNGRYDPELDQWSSVSTIDAPTGRDQHTATWTGAEMIIWGGVVRHCDLNNCFTSTNTGGRYDPATDTWVPMSTVGAPSPRRHHSAIWTGTELIVWGGMGTDSSSPLGDGARYNPVTDTWSPLSDINAPPARGRHHAVFDGQQMTIWGGSSGSVIKTNGAIYDPMTDVWSVLPSQNAPGGTGSFDPASVVLTGPDMLVWLPESKWDYDPYIDEWFESFKSQTRRYDFQGQEWLTVVDACNPRATPNAVWLNGRMLSWGKDYSDGQFYDEQLDTWAPITPYPGMPAEDATVLVVGDTVIVWGGKRGYSNITNTGYRLSL